MDNFQYSTFQLNHSVCVADAFSSIAYCIELSTTLFFCATELAVLHKTEQLLCSDGFMRKKFDHKSQCFF